MTRILGLLGLDVVVIAALLFGGCAGMWDVTYSGATQTEPSRFGFSGGGTAFTKTTKFYMNIDGKIMSYDYSDQSPLVYGYTVLGAADKLAGLTGDGAVKVIEAIKQ